MQAPWDELVTCISFILMQGLSQAPRGGPQCLLKLLTLSPALLRTLRTYQTVLKSDAQHDKRYVDRLKITARAGKGGNGCFSYYQGASRGANTVLANAR